MKNKYFCAFSGVMVMLACGIVYAWSVFSTFIGRSFPELSAASLSFTFTLCMISFCIGGFVSSPLIRKLKAHGVIWISAVLMSLGLYLSSLANGTMLLYVGFGVLGGVSSGLAYNAALSTVSSHFPGRSGMISGVLLMGFGVSSFAVGKVFQVLAATLESGWRGSFVFFSLLALLLMGIFGTFIRRPEGAIVNQKAKGGERPDFTPSQMLKHPSFLLYFFWCLSMSVVGLSLMSQSSGFVLGVNPSFSMALVSTVVGLISIFNALGRLFAGWLFDKKGSLWTMLEVDIFYLIAISLMIYSHLSSNLVPLVISFIIAGLAYGGVSSTNSAFIAYSFGQKHYSRNYPFINMNLLVSSFGSTLAGGLLDKTGTYISVFLMMGAFVLIDTVITVFVEKFKVK